MHHLIDPATGAPAVGGPLTVTVVADDAAKAEAEMIGLVALIPAVVDAVRIPVVATGGIADARGVAAALTLVPRVIHNVG